jgi:hypothetical protein
VQAACLVHLALHEVHSELEGWVVCREVQLARREAHGELEVVLFW